MQEHIVENIATIDSLDEMEEIIGNPPSWLSRSGISMLFIASIGILTLCRFISYPDKIAANGMVTTTQQAIVLTSPKTAKVEKIFFDNNDSVKLDWPVLYLANSATLEDVKVLELWLDLGVEKIFKDKVKLPTHLNIGPLQALYAQIYIAIENYFHLNSQFFSEEETTSISEEIKNLSKLNALLTKEAELFDAEINLEKSDLERSRKLLVAGIISRQDFEKAEMKYNQLVRQQMSYSNNQIQNVIRKDQLTLQKKRINFNRSLTLVQQQFEIKKLLTQMKSAIHEWKKANFIFANLDGIFQLDHNIIEQNTVGVGQPIGYIVPSDEMDGYYVKAECNNYGLAKVKSGARAIVKLNAYPFKEYGFLEGCIENISLLPFERSNASHQYQIKIILPDGLKTNYGKTLSYKPNMTASIELITKDKSILERIFEQFISLVREKQLP